MLSVLVVGGGLMGVGFGEYLSYGAGSLLKGAGRGRDSIFLSHHTNTPP